MKRLFWFVLGVCAGAMGVSWARRKVVDLSEQVTLASVFSLLINTGRSVVGSVFAVVQGYFGQHNASSDAAPPMYVSDDYVDASNPPRG